MTDDKLRTERCFLCDEPTEKAGPGDGSLYSDDVGPFCRRCYGLISPIIDRLEKAEAECVSCPRCKGQQGSISYAMIVDETGRYHTAACLCGWSILGAEDELATLKQRAEKAERELDLAVLCRNEAQKKISRLKRERDETQEKLQRVRDWLKFHANSEGGIIAEIENVVPRPTGEETDDR